MSGPGGRRARALLFAATATAIVLVAGYVQLRQPFAGPAVPSLTPGTVQPTLAATPMESPVALPSPTAVPSSAPPEVVTTAVEAPAAPAYRIEIPRLGVNLPVAEGDIPRDVVNSQTPEHYAFHLPGTSLFGAGNTYIYAHARPGMFLSLWSARVGDVVIVRTPAGMRRYVVAEIHPRVPPTQTSWAAPTADTRLTLQTSTGPYDDDPRFVVVARPG